MLNAIRAFVSRNPCGPPAFGGRGWGKPGGRYPIRLSEGLQAKVGHLPIVKRLGQVAGLSTLLLIEKGIGSGGGPDPGTAESGPLPGAGAALSVPVGAAGSPSDGLPRRSGCLIGAGCRRKRGNRSSRHWPRRNWRQQPPGFAAPSSNRCWRSTSPDWGPRKSPSNWGSWREFALLAGYRPAETELQTGSGGLPRDRPHSGEAADE